MLSLESILQSGAKLVEVNVPEWGGAVKIKPLSVAELISVLEGANEPAARTLQLVARSLCDDQGAPLCAADQGDALAQASGAGLLRVAAVALALNGLTEAAQTHLGKPSAPTLDGASSSDSPANSAAPSAS